MPTLTAFIARALHARFVAAASAAVPSLTAFGGSDNPSFKPIELNIAHINDHHSNLEAIPGFRLKLDGVDKQVDIGGLARQTALFKAAASRPNLLKLHAGHAITGSLYYTFFKGEADAKMMNIICFDAFTVGNHEFADGDATAAAFIDLLTKGGRPTPMAMVSANIVPKVGTPLLPTADKPAFKPYIIKKIDGVDVAIIGVATDQRTKQSSRPLESTQFLEPVAATQKAVDEVRAQGVRHVVLLSHLGDDKDRAPAPQLTDVDVIIGGDSHTLLGDFKAQGSDSAGAYPMVVKNKDGDTVCIGQAWEHAKVFGQMNMKFDDRGRVAACGGQASLVIGDNYKRLGSDGKTWTALPDAGATRVLGSYKGKVTEAKAQVSSAAPRKTSA